MAKRFTDTTKWSDPWFDELQLIEKMFWIFILDYCDHAGIWKENWKQVQYCIGSRPDMEKFRGRIFEVAPGKLFIPKFLIFQYGTDWRHSKASASKSARKILMDLGIEEKVEEFLKLVNSSPSLTEGLVNSSPSLTTTATTTATATSKAKTTTKASVRSLLSHATPPAVFNGNGRGKFGGKAA